MIPIDYRNANWTELSVRLQGARQQVYKLLQQHGPCTTRELAIASCRDVCSVRPRITELVELGLAACEGGAGKEGRYRAVPLHVAEESFASKCREARSRQLMLL